MIFIEVKITEQRVQTEDKIQLRNKSRHFMKNWYKSGKELSEIGNQYQIHGKSSYLRLLPSLPAEFSSLELQEALNTKDYPTNAKKQANLILWLYSRMNLIFLTEKKGRRLYYRLNKKFSQYKYYFFVIFFLAYNIKKRQFVENSTIMPLLTHIYKKFLLQ